ncbi:hypothetical protein ACHHYP_20782 [Achlya hypogyna]|uniref:Uncharacterized protein n=1 Tax=Achlya hypogyna TaxID=1202772 RepID=A0A1V9ZER1_ACHHY|nr:hypothetical protein ACHHYP_20782 [Achlya hypogyna]
MDREKQGRKCMQRSLRVFKDDVRVSFSMWASDMDCLGKILGRLIVKHQDARTRHHLRAAHEAHATEVETLQRRVDDQECRLRCLQEELREKERELATLRTQQKDTPSALNSSINTPVKELRRSQRLHASATKTQNAEAPTSKRKSSTSTRSILKKLKNDDEPAGQDENKASLPKQVSFRSPSPQLSTKSSPLRTVGGRKPLHEHAFQATPSASKAGRVRVATPRVTALPATRVPVSVKQHASNSLTSTSVSRKRWS